MAFVSQNHIVLFFCLLLFRLSAADQDAVKAGYWYRGSGSVSDIDSSLFTHLFCAFAGLNPDTNEVTISDDNEDAFSTFTRTLQCSNPSITTLLSIGGGETDPHSFVSMAKNPSSREIFINSSINIARFYGFHGLDLAWESPTTADEMSYFGLLLDEWRTAVDAESNESGESPLILTAAVHYSPDIGSVTFPVDSIRRSLDWINVVAFDYYTPSWAPFTGAHALLYDLPNRVSTSSGIRAWIDSGLAPDTLVLGLPYYGYAWKLKKSGNHGVGARANGPAVTKDGEMTYRKIKEFIKKKRAKSIYNSTIVANYCYSGTTWIGYDDVQAIKTKVFYAKDQGLLGYFVWHVGGDKNWVLSQKASSTWDSLE
ncbi:PREDICTED: chitotriosidase-1-like [Nelumbo nucifera]|uniref:Chitotriosidase-1-like n=2 Tax=Nelumbo nucifera TaxID=4432 RepID=A0A1U8BGM7_NELNU|nr:PREDICTED: chitotriosidase-1-like [Nelumbo nucifera]DAD45184.1 TPA_asm: hypothetical protein HUJ06_003414 [Nelumbo nucifera]